MLSNSYCKREISFVSLRAWAWEALKADSRLESWRRVDWSSCELGVSGGRGEGEGEGVSIGRGQGRGKRGGQAKGRGKTGKNSQQWLV